ncbi:putative ATP-grasp enzyme [Halanaeroarchaeum sp. HSR-CO]|nr:putative ATP-grasp enzyme [Halanaeroarchaeum sp. HSR-CO]
MGSASSTTVLRSLGQRGIHTIAVSEHRNPPAFASKYCDESVRAPSPTEDVSAYRDALLSLAQRESVKAIIPMREADVYVLAKYRERFAEHVTPLWPTLDQLTAVQDRTRLFAIADEIGVPMPETALLEAVTDWDRQRIVKSRYAILTGDHEDSVSTAGTVSLPKTIFLESGERPELDTIREAMHHDPIVQEYVRGTEYTFRGVFDHGEPVATTLKELVRGIKYPRGPSICHRAASDPDLEASALKLLDHLDWHGLASVGFIRDEETGEAKLMEVNPRFWASLPMDIHAGVDHPYYYWALATGVGERFDPEYRVGTTSHLLRGELVHLHSVLTEDYPLVERPSVQDTVWDILSSVAEHPHFDYLSLDDPGPFVRDGLNAVRTNVAVSQVPGLRRVFSRE